MVSPTGLAARERHDSYDEEAYTTLELRGLSTRSAFDQDAVDLALDDLMKQPRRDASGERLARNLRRSAWTKLVSHRRSERQLEFEHAILGRPLVPFRHEVQDAKSAVGVVKSAISRLPDRQRRALFSAILGVAAVEAGRRLGVSERQFRNLANAARARLSDDDQCDDAFRTLLDLFRRQPAVAVQALAPVFEEWGLL